MQMQLPLPSALAGFAEQLETIREAYHAELRSRPVLSASRAVVDYLTASIAFNETESMHVLYLDKRNRLIVDDTHSQGTVDFCPVMPREIVKRALLLNASAIILAHNHPSGDPTPSSADIAMTHKIADACKVLGIDVLDHIIVGKGGHASMRALRVLS